MRKNIRFFTYGLAVIAILSLIGTNVYSVMTMNKMKQSLTNMKTNIKQVSEDLTKQADTIAGSITASMEKQNSLISSFEFIYGDLELTKGLINMQVVVVPKESTNDTKMKITFNTENGKMKEVTAKKQSDNQFTAKLTLPYDKDYRIGAIISEGNVTKQEYLDWVYNLKDQTQMQVDGAFVDGEVTYSLDKIAVNGLVRVDAYGPSHLNSETLENDIVSAIAYVLVNGEVVETFPMEREEVQENEINYSVEIKQKYDFKTGDVFEIVVELDDETGFHYKTHAARNSFNEEMEFIFEDYGYGNVEITP